MYRTLRLLLFFAILSLEVGLAQSVSVQSKACGMSAGVSGSSITCAFDAPTTAGNAIMAFATIIDPIFFVPDPPTVADSQTNTYSLLKRGDILQSVPSVSHGSWVLWATGIAGGSTTVTFSGAASTAIFQVIVSEFAGTTGAIDISSQSYVQSVTSTNPSLTTTTTDILLSYLWVNPGGGGVRTFSISPGTWNREARVDGGNGGAATCLMDARGSVSAATYSPTITASPSTSGNFQSIMVGFQGTPPGTTRSVKHKVVQ